MTTFAVCEDPEQFRDKVVAYMLERAKMLEASAKSQTSQRTKSELLCAVNHLEYVAADIRDIKIVSEPPKKLQSFTLI